MMGDFNSIKVRLKHELNPHGNLLIVFQFHKGTIETNQCDFPSMCRRLFQFHKGTIETPKAKIAPPTSSNFNSIKVRLKPFSDGTPIPLDKEFQFHKGTIETHRF